MHRFLSTRLLTLVLLLLSLEYALSPLFLLLGARIEFLHLLVVSYAFFWSWRLVPFFALTVGLLQDFVGGHLFGIETFTLTAGSLLLQLSVQKLERENPWIRLGIVYFFISFTEFMGLGLGSWLGASRPPAWDLTRSVFWTTIYTTIFTPGFFWLVRLWLKQGLRLRQYELFK